MIYAGWRIDDRDARRVLSSRPPLFPIVRLHHVTFAVGDATPPPAAELRLVGWAADDHCECYVVEVNGERVRPDGRIYHATVSRDKTVGSQHSNVVLESGWTEIDPITIHGLPFGRGE